MNEKDLASILDKSRKIFLIETQNKLKDNFIHFLNFYSSHNDTDRFNIENFFHSIKGMSAMSGFFDLEKKSSEMEIFSLNLKDKNPITSEDILKLLDGYSEILRNVNTLSMDHLLTSAENEINELTSVIPDKVSLKEVYTKEYFYEDFKNYICNHQNTDILFSICLIDIDHFNSINKEKGYFVGDLILKRFAQFLNDNLQNENSQNSNVYRFEDDKFIIVFKDTDSPDAHYYILELLNKLNSIKIEPLDRYITFSSAICTIKNPDENIESTLVNLYDALEKSKSLGESKITLIKRESIRIKKIKILIVEDLSVTVYFIRKHLENLNYDIYHSADGVDALNQASKLQPDILILDLMLPKMNGYEVCKRIKEKESLKDTKIIVLSSKNSDEDILKCYQMGIDDFISKPFSMADLEKRLKRLF